MRIGLLLILTSALFTSGCLDNNYNLNLDMENVSYLVETEFKSRLKEKGVVSIYCPLPKDAGTTCYTSDKAGYDASFILPIKIEWKTGFGLKMSPSAMSRFTPDDLLQMIVEEHIKDRVIDENVDLWRNSYPSWETVNDT